VQIFLLEDNPYEAAFFRSCMEERSHDVHHFSRCVDLMEALSRQTPHLVVLDWALEDVTGYIALKRIRDRYSSTMPIVMLTCMDDTDQIVSALESGADDYLLKPMTRPVLVARLEALMRRFSQGNDRSVKVLQEGPYELDFRQQTLTIDGIAVVLTPKEFDLSWVLFSQINSFISKSELIAGVWGRRAEISSHTVTQHIHVLRKKLGLAENMYRLSAIYGSGYRLESMAHLRESTPSTLVAPKGLAPLNAEPL
jgi:DNA-binding response OmpR family regulator